MDWNEFIEKTNAIAARASETTDEETRKKLNDEFFNVGIAMFNEHCTGDMTLADGRTIFVGAIDPFDL